MLNSDIIKDIAADASALTQALLQENILRGDISGLVAAAMPEIVRYETGVLRLAPDRTLEENDAGRPEPDHPEPDHPEPGRRRVRSLDEFPG